MNIYEKLLAVKEQVPYIKKDKASYNYTYTTPSQVLGIINPLLNKAKLLLLTKVIGCKSQRIEIVTTKKTSWEWLYELDVLFTWIDAETGESLDIPFKAAGCNGEDKGIGSALTYAERYFLLKQFNIPTDDDDPDRFQAKHMSEDDKKAVETEKKKGILALQQEEEQRQRQELAEYTKKILLCDTIKDLKEIKAGTPPWIRNNKDWQGAATKRFTEINSIPV